MSERKIFSGGEFLITDINSEDIFTPEDFSNEHKMVYKAALDFVRKELSENAELIEEKNENQIRKWFKMAGELGLNAPDSPEELGGEGMDKISACLISEVFGEAHSFGVSHLCQTGIGTLPILLFGNDDQKRKYIPKLASGEHIGAYCLTESGAGSDALNAQTTATLSDDGKYYILNGEKIFITNGKWADVFTVFAKVDGEKFTGFIVEKGFYGLSIGNEEEKMGIKGSSTVPVIFKNCKVPVENVLFEIGQGHKIAFNVLNIGRYKLGPCATGAAKAALLRSLKYANERVQFGKKISSFGMVRNKLAEMTIKTYMAETLSYRLAAAIDDNLNTLNEKAKKSGEEIAKAIEEYSIECAIGKVAATEFLDYVVDEMVQIYGGNGYIAEYPAERAYRDSRINRIFEGTNEINRLVITGNTIKRAMSKKINLMDKIASINDDIKSNKISLNKEGEILSKQKNLLNITKDLFIYTLSITFNKLKDLQKEQVVIALLADIIIQIYVMESGLLRAMKFAEKKGEKKAELHIAAVKVYISNIIPEIVYNAKQIIIYANKGESVDEILENLDNFTKYSPDNIIELKRIIADRVIKSKKYPF